MFHRLKPAPANEYAAPGGGLATPCANAPGSERFQRWKELSHNTGGAIDVRKLQWCSPIRWLRCPKCVIRRKCRFIKRHFGGLLSVRVPARMCTRNIAACRAPALNLRICATIGGGRECRRMLSSEAKTLSLRRLGARCPRPESQWRCNASVVASLDGSARRARHPALRTIVRLGVSAIGRCRGAAGAREPNYALHRSVDSAALRSGSHRAAGERER